MTDGVRVVTNLPEFTRHLQAIEKKFGEQTVRRAVSAAGAVFSRAIRQKAPVLKPENARKKAQKGRPPVVAGVLRRAVYRKRGKKKPGVESMMIGIKQGPKAAKKSGNDAFYWRFLEDGWLPRGGAGKIGGGKRLRALRKRRFIEGGKKEVSYPFIAPAWAVSQSKALAAFYTKMDTEVTRISKERTPK